MRRERIVKLSGNAVELRQTSPRNIGEIMVLIVVASVVNKDIERAVVTVGLGQARVIGLKGSGLVLRDGLLRGVHHVVLGNEMTGNRVPRTSQEPGKQKVL